MANAAFCTSGLLLFYVALRQLLLSRFDPPVQLHVALFGGVLCCNFLLVANCMWLSGSFLCRDEASSVFMCLMFTPHLNNSLIFCAAFESAWSSTWSSQPSGVLAIV